VSYRFDRYELFPGAEQLRKRGMLVHLGPQPFRVLVMLVSRAGSIVTRDEIQKELWGEETFVDFEQGINAVIRRIRFALNDQAETPRFLQTLPRRGYCFLVPVERVEPDDRKGDSEEGAPSPAPDAAPSVVTPGRIRLSFALAFTAALLLLIRGAHQVSEGPGSLPRPPLAHVQDSALRIAIAPVIVDGPRSALDDRTLSTELRRYLSRISPDRVRVVAPGGPADLRVETTMRTSPEGPSVDARLTETPSGRLIWSETLHPTGDAGDFSLEAAIRVTRTVIHFYAPRKRREAPVRTRASPKALALFREGQALRHRPVPQIDHKRAMKLFEQATSMEPKFAEAWAAMGDIWTTRTMVWKGEPRQRALVEARITLDRAIAADPRCAEALNNRALLLMQVDRSYRGAETALRAAVAADPAYFDARFNLALLLGAMGHHEESLSEMQRAQQLDPASLTPNPALAFLYLLARRYGDAYAEYRALLASRRQPDMARWGMMSGAISAGRWDDAARSLSAVLGERIEIPLDSPDPRLDLRKHVRLLDERLPSLKHTGLDPYTLASFHAQTGDADLAFAALDRAEKLELVDTMFAYVDPRLDSIRQDPRFTEYLLRVGLLR
jgi:DNA-binding winged helix-turn-helix (wHTH) protein/tetratricopeptide (TPR) repeat protein